MQQEQVGGGDRRRDITDKATNLLFASRIAFNRSPQSSASLSLIMPGFRDLPLELLPHIFVHIFKPTDLANLCLVNRQFYDFAIGFLYDQIYIYAWHRQAKSKVRFMVELLTCALPIGPEMGRSQFCFQLLLSTLTWRKEFMY